MALTDTGINQPPLPFKDFYLGGIKFDKKLLDNSVAAAKESGIENEDLLKQTAFQIYYGEPQLRSNNRIKNNVVKYSELQLQSTNRIKNNVAFWFWITAGWILIAIAGVLGIGFSFGLV